MANNTPTKPDRPRVLIPPFTPAHSPLYEALANLVGAVTELGEAPTREQLDRIQAAKHVAEAVLVVEK